jgi:Protein of unknown function (DUF3562)
MSDAPTLPSVHQRVISSLAKDNNATIDEVTALYTLELEKLAVDARVRDFLPVLAARHVKSTLRNRAQSTADARQPVSV